MYTKEVSYLSEFHSNLPCSQISLFLKRCQVKCARSGTETFFCLSTLGAVLHGTLNLTLLMDMTCALTCPLVFFRLGACLSFESRKNFSSLHSCKFGYLPISRPEGCHRERKIKTLHCIYHIITIYTRAIVAPLILIQVLGIIPKKNYPHSKRTCLLFAFWLLVGLEVH